LKKKKINKKFPRKIRDFLNFVQKILLLFQLSHTAAPLWYKHKLADSDPIRQGCAAINLGI